jgi:His-Xaa-Ser system radical SAM maturase HxsC
MTPLRLSGRADAVTAPGGEAPFVLRLTSPSSAPRSFADAAIVRSASDLAEAEAAGLGAVVAVGMHEAEVQGFRRSVVLDNRFDYLAEGDILGVRPRNRGVRALYRRCSAHNSFLVTERCNHWCLMCSQPPRDVDDGWIIDEIADCLPLIDPAPSSLGFTGGEPLLDWRQFVGLLAGARDQLPTVALHVLTNGRAFADPEVTSAWAALDHPNLTAGIPVYAAVSDLHDYVVQSRGAFDQTVLGILRLKDRGQRVEVRVVLHALTAPRLLQTAAWIARSLPFMDHVALMGLENTGFAVANHDLLWIDPLDYQSQLAEAVAILQSAGLHVSVYNLPLCVLDPSVWPVSVQSISDWKNEYLPGCHACAVRSKCAGFFSSGVLRYSRGVHPVSCGHTLTRCDRADQSRRGLVSEWRAP